MFRATLDPSAVAAYVAGSEHVGEVLAEIADEQAMVAVPVPCLVDGFLSNPGGASPLLAILVKSPTVRVLPVDADAWELLGPAAARLGSLGRACAALLVASGEAQYVVTAEPDVYGGRVDTVQVW